MTGQDYPLIQEYRSIEFTAANATTVLWAPRVTTFGTTAKVTLTGISFSTNIPSSVVIYVGSTGAGPQKIAMFMAGSSATISPTIGMIRNTMQGGNLYAVIGNGSSAGAALLVTGFEEE